MSLSIFQSRHLSALYIAAATLFTGCSQNNWDEHPPLKSPSGKITLIASTEETNDTKVNLEEGESNRVILSWAEQDSISLFNSAGNRICNFALMEGSGSKIAVFEQVEQVDLVEGERYTAIFPATTLEKLSELKEDLSVQTQTGNGTLSHLNKVCHMRAHYNYNPGERGSIAFIHQYAMMRVTAAPPPNYTANLGKPTLLYVTNGTNSYRVELQEIDSWNAPLVVNLMIDSTQATTRELLFQVVTDSLRCFQTTVTGVSKAYLPGKRYDAPLTSDKTPIAYGGNTASSYEAKSIPASNLWVVSDASVADHNAFDGLRRALNAIASSGRKISLLFPNLTNFPSNALSATSSEADQYPATALTGVMAPKALTVGDLAFSACSSLESIALPHAKTIGNYTFRGGYSLRQAMLPRATSIGNYAFYDCSSLQLEELPLAVTVGGYAFYGCFSLQSVLLPNVTNLGASAFRNCLTLESMQLPKVENINYMAFSGCSALTSLLIATQSTLTIFGDEDKDLFGDRALSDIALTIGANNGSKVNGVNWTTPTAAGWVTYYGFKSITVQ